MKIGLIGGTRFIGYHLARSLLASGHELRLFNRGITAPPAPFPDTVTWVRGDRRDPAAWDKFFSHKLDAVIDLTAYRLSEVTFFLENYGERFGHYVFCSTSSAVLPPAPVPYDETAPLDLTPGTYGGEKGRIEDFLRQRADSLPATFTVLRPQGVLGEHDLAHAGHVFSRLKRGVPIVMRERESRAQINLCDVNDLVGAFERSITDPRARGQVFNVANREPVSLEQFVLACGRAWDSGVTPKIIKLGDGEARPFRFGVPSWHDYDLVAKNEKIVSTLDVKFRSLDETLARLAAWAKRNPARITFGLQKGEKFLVKGEPIPTWFSQYWRVRDWPGWSRVPRQLRYWREKYLYRTFAR